MQNTTTTVETEIATVIATETVIATPTTTHGDAFNLNLATIMRDGRISTNTKLFYDYIQGSYVTISSGEGVDKIDYLNKEGATHKIFEAFKNVGIELKNPAAALKNVKKTNIVFNVSSDEEEYTNNFGHFYNLFNRKNSRLIEMREIRSQTEERYIGIDMLKRDCPYTYGLLKNTHEYNDLAVDHFINYVSAFFLTRKKIPTAFLYAGSIEGTGKGVTYTLLEMIIGKQYSVQAVASTLESTFDDIVESKLLLSFNEVSSDFKKKDSAMQKLKMYITDNSFLLNPKGKKSYSQDNYFMILMSTNHEDSVKMSSTERRFNLFSQSRTLKAMAAEDFSIDETTFCNNVYAELDKFINFLSLYEYDRKRAQQIFLTDAKIRSQEATSNPSEKLFELIKTKNVDVLCDKVLEIMDFFYETNINDRRKYTDSYILSIPENISVIRDSLTDEFAQDCVSIKTLRRLYTLLVDDNNSKTDRVIAKIFASKFGESISKRISGELLKVKVIATIKTL